MWDLVVLGKRVTRLLVVFIGSCSGYPIINRVVFGSRVTIRLTIGPGSCHTRLCNRVGRVDTNPTREPELPTPVVALLDLLDFHQQATRSSTLLGMTQEIPKREKMLFYRAEATSQCRRI
jgi:hypothetical protein